MQLRYFTFSILAYVYYIFFIYNYYAQYLYKQINTILLLHAVSTNEWFA